MTLARSLLVLAAALALPAAAAAQSTPARTAQAFFDAMHAARWHDAAALVEPASLARYHRRELTWVVWSELLRWSNPEYVISSDTLYSALPVDTMMSPSVPQPIDLAAHDTLSLALFGRRTVGALRSMPSAEFLAQALAMYDRLYPTPDTLGDGGPPRPPLIVGTLMRGDTAAYVVYTVEEVVSLPDGRLDRYEELSQESLLLVRRQGGWRVRLNRYYAPIISAMYTLDGVEAEPGTGGEPAP